MIISAGSTSLKLRSTAQSPKLQRKSKRKTLFGKNSKLKMTFQMPLDYPA